MKKKVLYTFFFLLPIISIAQKNTVRLKSGCAFSGYIKDRYICEEVSKNVSNLLTNMVNFNGFKGDQIRLYSSKEVNYAVTGLDSENYVCVIINEDDIKGAIEFTTSILAHELGHIYRRHIYSETALNKDNELQADYYLGFWSRKAKRKIEETVGPLKLVSEDILHPDQKTRENHVNSGFNDGSKEFYKNDLLIDKKDKYKDILDLYMVINSYRESSKNFKVSFQLTSIDPKVPTSEIVSDIVKVNYIFHEKTFKHPYVTSRNINKDNFKYNIVVWGAFPIVTLVYFRDGSILPIIKDFEIPTNKRKSDY